ncbi:MAG: tRNA (adenosine(37)-N6)-threonylcarbamoyltransferase complex transferase subunit TsaD [Candidatus Aminicenantes bacterium]|nr:MAG: tRNA (adenosine(37)-N6)-threonylcarbamoyltransferase complex transferase subunit TsaD [Candidatus Aminicenantes bacterium]
MSILGIETSCDETAASVVKGDFEILSNVVLSQDEIHAPFGGVVPELASRQHLTFIGYVIQESLNRAKLKLDEIDVYAVTQGPGLIGSLLVGLSFAKGLTYYFEKPLIAIDHLEAHIHSALLDTRNIPFPALALVVSGGHTSLFFMKKKLNLELIGKTRDDAAGEALDKIAKFLDLGYPGGPIIDKLAEKGNPQKFAFGLPHMTDGSLDFSFSGLKTAALKKIKEYEISKSHSDFFDFLASFEKAVIRALLANMAKAINIYKPKSLILCGGVARNKKLRQQFTEFAQESRLSFSIPSPEFCTDNAAMVATLALEKLKSGEKPSFAQDLNAYPRRAHINGVRLS